jgi:two-component system, chemotaxis family, protein-glutamate methylesterase/glutaminase
MSRAGRNVVVIGTSAGGLQALDELIGQLPAGLPAAFFIVQHMAAEASGEALVQALGRRKTFRCKIASDGETFKNGTIYIARPDYHMLVKKTTLLVTKGARENRYRPAVDPLFRSAAVTHGAAVIGVLLTGMLDDGTAGLLAIQKCGGVTVVQDPNDAAYPQMPQSAINHVDVAHVVTLADMGPLLERLIHERPGKDKRVPKDVQTEAVIAERVLSDVAQVNGLGQQVPYNCPNCGGVLWEVDTPDLQRYRCHTGHSYTAHALLDTQTEKIEETLWVSLRMLEERKNLLNTMIQREPRGSAVGKAYAERVRENEIHIERIRAMLLAREDRS